MNAQIKNWLLQKNYKQLLLVVFLFSTSLKAQVINYVNNPSFEMILPTATVNPFDAVKYWGAIDSTSNAASYVYSQTLGTVPYALGYQWPRSGKSFILSQFYCAASFCSNSTRFNPRNRLKQVLKPNTAYCAKYYIVNTNNCPVGIDSYGAYFGSSSIDTISHCSIPLTYLIPQVQYIGGIITDTLNWVPITGTFVANGTEKYMVLGNFKSNATTNTVIINSASLPNLSNDVFIDDVSLIELDLPAYAGPDQWCIPGDSVFIGRQPDVGIDEDCMWYKLPNSTTAIDTVAGLWVKPNTTTTYLVRQEICGNVKWDLVTVYQSATGLAELEMQSQNLKVYPQPATDEITIELLSNQPHADFKRMSISNSLGQIIREEEIQFKNNNTIVKTSDLPNGVYMLIIIEKDNFQITKRFVIAR